MKKFQVYLMLDSKFSSPYTYIIANECIQVGETSVKADGVLIDFHNEVLGLSELERKK